MTKVSFTGDATKLAILDGRKQEELKILSMLVDRMADEKYGATNLLHRASICLSELISLNREIQEILARRENGNEIHR